MSENILKALEQFNQSIKQIDDIYHVYAVKCGLSDSAFWILYSLCQADKPYTQNDFCTEWYYPKQTVNSTVSNLIKHGYVILESTPGTRKSKEIVLTDAGKAYTEKTIRPLLEAEQRAFEKMSAAEREAYLILINRHHDLLEQELTENSNENTII